MKTLLDEHNLKLTEAAIVERLRRSDRIGLHPRSGPCCTHLR